jgi:hypothetical protein
MPAPMTITATRTPARASAPTGPFIVNMSVQLRIRAASRCPNFCASRVRRHRQSPLPAKGGMISWGRAIGVVGSGRKPHVSLVV